MKWAALGVGLLIAVSLLWLAGEQHYDNCISEAEAAYPVLVEDGLTGPGDNNAGRRRRALDDCSRLPF